MDGIKLTQQLVDRLTLFDSSFYSRFSERFRRFQGQIIHHRDIIRLYIEAWIRQCDHQSHGYIEFIHSFLTWDQMHVQWLTILSPNRNCFYQLYQMVEEHKKGGTRHLYNIYLQYKEQMDQQDYGDFPVKPFLEQPMHSMKGETIVQSKANQNDYIYKWGPPTN